MENLRLQPKSQESKDRAWQLKASPQKEEKPRKQFQFQVNEELGEELGLPLDLTHFLVEGAAPEQRNAPNLTARPSTTTKIPQSSLALTGGACPKVLAAAFPS